MYPYQQAFAPYQQVTPQYQQPYMQRQTYGRPVKSPDEIMVQEVPTDGSLACFPASDGSCIWVKRWDPNGTIQTIRYIPEQTPQEHEEDPVTSVNDKLDQALAMLATISEQTAKTRRTVKSNEQQ